MDLMLNLAFSNTPMDLLKRSIRSIRFIHIVCGRHGSLVQVYLRARKARFHMRSKFLRKNLLHHNFSTNRGCVTQRHKCSAFTIHRFTFWMGSFSQKSFRFTKINLEVRIFLLNCWSKNWSQITTGHQSIVAKTMKLKLVRTLNSKYLRTKVNN